MGSVILSAAIVAITGLLVGLLLGVAAEKFKVPVDEKELAVRDCLPGNNCGGCGFAGCDALAKAIAAGEAAVNACPVGGAPVGNQIAAIMGAAVEEKEPEVAYVKCSGSCDKASVKYNYYGIDDCVKASMIPGRGDKKCATGCLGLGSCTKECQFDAIHVIGGIAVVDKEKCVACGKCIATCPNHLIELVPKKAVYTVACSSTAKGVEVKNSCEAGCIGCGICAKQCEAGAITVENNIAHIDQSKCTGCGKCVAKCPQKVIVAH